MPAHCGPTMGGMGHLPPASRCQGYACTWHTPAATLLTLGITALTPPAPGMPHPAVFFVLAYLALKYVRHVRR